MHDTHEIIQRAWSLHQSGKTAEAVALLDSEIPVSASKRTVESIAYNRSQILIGSGRYKDAEAGLREVIRLPPGSSEPGCPSAELVDCLFMALAVGGGEMDLGVIRWLLTDCQDRGLWQEALNFAGILISYLQKTDPLEALTMAQRWKIEAEAIGEEGHANGLQGIIEALTEQ